MTAWNDRTYDTDLLDVLSRRVLVGAAMGTQSQAADPTLDDFKHLEGCNETRPDEIEQTHRNDFEAAADAVETKYVRLQSG